MSRRDIEVVFMVTRSVISSEGPKNYTLRLFSLLRSFGVNANFDIIMNNFIVPFKTLYYVVRGHVVVFPFIKGIELLTILLSIPLAILSKAKIVVVNHDVHGLYAPRHSLLWRILIIMRSGRLLDVPFSPIRVIYVSRYSKRSSYCVTGSKHVLEKGLVLYPITRRELLSEPRKKINVQPAKLCVFAKVVKMLDETFWNVIGRCLENLAEQGVNFTLTIMGSGSTDTIEALKNIISRNFKPNVLGKTSFKFNVSDRERDRELEESLILIYPPSTEGLGMHVFEAVMRRVIVLSARQTALVEFVPPWIYSHREFKYPQFCESLANAMVNYSEMFSYVENMRKRIARLTLTGLRRFINNIRV